MAPRALAMERLATSTRVRLEHHISRELQPAARTLASEPDRPAVLVGGSAHVEGVVMGDVVAVGGTVHVGPDAEIMGEAVKNLSDGRVELVVEGPANEVTRFLEGVTRAMGGYIRDTQVAESPATGTFRHFDIAY